MARDVFISHATEDRGIAYTICDALERSGLTCWIAPRDIPPGQRWAETIVSAATEASVMIVVYSSHAMRSEHVQREVSLASESGVALLPTKLENVPIAGLMRYYLSHTQWHAVSSPPSVAELRALVETARAIVSGQVQLEMTPANPGGGRSGPRTTFVDKKVRRKRRRRVFLVAMGCSLGLLFACVAAVLILLKLQLPGRDEVPRVELFWDDAVDLNLEVWNADGTSFVGDALYLTDSDGWVADRDGEYIVFTNYDYYPDLSSGTYVVRVQWNDPDKNVTPGIPFEVVLTDSEHQVRRVQGMVYGDHPRDAWDAWSVNASDGTVVREIADHPKR